MTTNNNVYNNVRIAGIDIPANKKIQVALTSIYGIGLSLAKKVLDETHIKLSKRTKDLTENEIISLRKVIESDTLKVEGELRQIIFQNKKRLKDIKCYRGIRHKVGLPVRGQRTKSNARTVKGKAVAVGGLKRKIEKK